jgi:hypothetical protein
MHAREHPGGGSGESDGLDSTRGKNAMPEATGEDQHRWWMSRRAFLSSGAAAGVATVALGGAGTAGATAVTDADAMVLQVAAAGAVFPMRFNTRESESANARLTAARVARARGRCSAARAAQAERGARLLLDCRLGGVGTQELLKELSVLAAEGDADELADLTALVAVAGATLADRIDPEEDLRPGIWLGGLANMHRNGTTPVVGRTR